MSHAEEQRLKLRKKKKKKPKYVKGLFRETRGQFPSNRPVIDMISFWGRLPTAALAAAILATQLLGVDCKKSIHPILRAHLPFKCTN